MAFESVPVARGGAQTGHLRIYAQDIQQGEKAYKRGVLVLKSKLFDVAPEMGKWEAFVLLIDHKKKLVAVRAAKPNDADARAMPRASKSTHGRTRNVGIPAELAEEFAGTYTLDAPADADGMYVFKKSSDS